MQIALDLAHSMKGELLLVEPNIGVLPKAFSEHPHAGLASVEEAICSADIMLGLVDHEQFRRLSPEFLNEKVVIDTKGMWR